MLNLAPAPVTREAARAELRKFLALAELVDTPPQMFSELIDDEWHALLDDDAAYADLCNATVGHHVGHHKDAGHGVISWITDYHRQFGDLPPIWFADNNGFVDQDAYDLYRRTRTVTASWRCQPTTGDPDYATATK